MLNWSTLDGTNKGLHGIVMVSAVAFLSVGSMADRPAALGGSPEVRSRPGSGTSITGAIPAAAVS